MVHHVIIFNGFLDRFIIKRFAFWQTDEAIIVFLVLLGLIEDENFASVNDTVQK